MVAETRIDFFRKRSEIFRRWDVQVWKSFLVTSGQIPIFLLMIETLRRMSGFGTGILGMISHPFDSSLYGQADRSTVLEELSQSATVPIEQSFSTGGILSFENLLLPDTALALPFVLSASVLANLYLAQWNIRGERSTMMRRIDKITKMVALALGPLTLHFPSALVIYLISNSVYSGVQQMVFQKAMPIPTIPEPCKPKSKVTKKAAVAGI
ncbi:MAG: hypothetical protein M1819_005047 [Sarea resinae]|nr:MAG: hypothetical protein M1819_005047 [Sarea resinae]